MNEKTSKIVRTVYGALFGVMTVILGALLIWQVTEDYFTIESNAYRFTQSGLFARFARISPAFWIWVAMIAVGVVLWEVFTVKQKRGVYSDPRYILARYKKRIPSAVGEELKASLTYVEREEKILKILWLCCAAVGVAGIIYSIVYLAIPSHFTVVGNATHEVLKMAENILPWALVTFAFACGIAVYEGISAKRQIEHAKKLALGNKPKAVNHGKVYLVLHHKYFKLGLRIGIGCICFAFIIVGALNGNMAAILDKAINICSECIGLG